MKTHLALLRGINVSGHNMIKMEALKAALENIGFQNVETYIRSSVRHGRTNSYKMTL